MLVAALLGGQAVEAQQSSGGSASQPPAAAPKDALGRDTPRGTVLGFMNAARGGRDDISPSYLNTRLRGAAAEELARQLFVVLDSRLPPRLGEVSDLPEGSLPNPLKPDQDVIGTIATADGPLDVIVERVRTGSSGPVWLFSRATLDSIPDVYDEIDLVSFDSYLPTFLTAPKIAGIRLFQWLALGLGLPLVYRLTGLLGPIVRPFLLIWRRRRGVAADAPAMIAGPIRLLLVAIAIRAAIVFVELPLPERVFWSGTAGMLGIVAAAWMLLRLAAVVEQSMSRRLRDSGRGEVAAVLRLLRRLADVLVVAAGILVALHWFGVDPTAALAGLGIGGIAVALAAQKTLENVIGGLSIIFDKAVRVGDFLKLDATLGTVESIGLRSTRIRTLDRSVLCVPNGQIANANIETLSTRDKFWFHHFLTLRYGTTAAQMRAVVGGIRRYLAGHPVVDRRETIRVRFFRFGAFSLDVEIFAYLSSDQWESFLETQQEMLLEVMEIVERSGAVIALPSQTVHVADGLTGGIVPDRGVARSTVSGAVS
jgi:MscS family membrane protein